MRIIAVLALSTLATGVWSQQPQPRDTASFRSSTQLVLVPATVTDAAGKFVPGLMAEDFAVFEDDVERPIRQLALERVPVALAVVVDVSASMAGPRFADARQALIQLMDAMGADDQIAVVTFNDRSSVLVPWTTDRRAVADRLERVSLKGDTALYIGVEEGVRLLSRSPLPRRALLILSDGIDNYVDLVALPLRGTRAGFVRDFTAASRRIGRIREQLERSSATVYAVAPAAGTGQPDEQVDVAALRALTDPSGGYTVAVGSTRELLTIVPQVAQDLAAQYLLGFEPANGPDGKRHALRITATNPAHRVRARTGYQASER